MCAISSNFPVKKTSYWKGYGIRLYSPYRRCWSPFLGPAARKCNGGLGANHPVLSHTLPVYLPQISPGTHLELGRLWLSLQSRYWPPSQTEELDTLGLEPASSQTKTRPLTSESSAPTHSARTALFDIWTNLLEMKFTFAFQKHFFFCDFVFWSFYSVGFLTF